MKFNLSHIQFSHYDRKRNIKLPNKTSEELAELVGVILGDGNIHNSLNRVTIVGSIEDRFYYKNHLIPLITSLFNIIPDFKKRNDRKAYYIHFYSQAIISFFVRALGMIRGNKINAQIPEFITQKQEYIYSFLRGLFDTDGCLKFSKQTKQIHYYPRLEIGFKESNFVFEVISLVKKIGFNFATCFDNRSPKFIKFQISGSNNLENWMNNIGSNNIVQYSKYLYWKEFGYYIPKSSLKSRLNALNLNRNNLSHEFK